MSDDDAVRRTPSGAVLYPAGCHPGVLRGNNIVIRAEGGDPTPRYTRATRPPHARFFSVFIGVETAASRAAAARLKRLDLCRVVADWQAEYCAEGYFVARLRFRDGLLLVSPNFKFTMNSVRDLDAAIGVLWRFTGYLAAAMGTFVRPTLFTVPTLDSSGNLFHHLDSTGLLAAYPNVFRRPTDFHALTFRMPAPSRIAGIVYMNGAIVVCAPSLAAAPPVALSIAALAERFYVRRNLDAITVTQREMAAQASSAGAVAAATAAMRDTN
jgi:hypothetical protein